MKPRIVGFVVFAFLAGLAVVSGQSRGVPGEWPAWRGPERTGLSPEAGLLKSWPKDGPTLLWKATGLGDGYSTPSIAGGRIYLLGTKGRTEYVRCLDLKTGNSIWATEIGAEKGSYAGPRSTPTVDGELLFALSSNGKLVGLHPEKGTVVWKKDLMTDFGGRHGNWAYAESPLVDGDRLICTPGGDSATMVCLDKRTGKEIWRASTRGLRTKASEGGGGFGGGKGKGKGGMRGPRPYSEAGYASAIVAEFGGVRQYVQFLAGGVVGVRASDGKLLWHYDAPAVGSNANCATPIIHDGSVFAAASYRVGGGRAQIVRSGDTFSAKQVYFVNEMQNHHGGMVLVDGHIYGTNNTSLVCLEFKTGKIKWSTRGVGKGSVLYADGHIYHRGENGDVALVEVNPNEYKEKGRFRQPNRSDYKAWPHPVIAGGKLYLRDWDTLLCFDVKAH
jgi:outer membrane protein assembly factor BamB